MRETESNLFYVQLPAGIKGFDKEFWKNVKNKNLLKPYTRQNSSSSAGFEVSEDIFSVNSKINLIASTTQEYNYYKEYIPRIRKVFDFQIIEDLDKDKFNETLKEVFNKPAVERVTHGDNDGIFSAKDVTSKVPTKGKNRRVEFIPKQPNPPENPEDKVGYTSQPLQNVVDTPGKNSKNNTPDIVGQLNELFTYSNVARALAYSAVLATTAYAVYNNIIGIIPGVVTAGVILGTEQIMKNLCFSREHHQPTVDTNRAM